MACTAAALMQENIWVDRFRVQDAEMAYHQALASQRVGLVVQSATNQSSGGEENAGSDIINEIVRARENIKNSLTDGVGLKIGVGVDNPELQARLSAVEQENKELKRVSASLQASGRTDSSVNALEKAAGGSSAPSAPKAAPAKPEEDEDDDDDDDIDLFGDDDDDEVEKLKEEKKKEVDAKKKRKVSGKVKPAVIAKSSILLDVKPWDDETDMADIEKNVRTIVSDGLVWGASKLVPVGYGIKKLQIMCVVEDDKVGTDFLEESITAFEDLVQSVDIVAFNKI
ncbi:LOW QUALITY PROTEIN: elongation factor 1-delta-like [Amphiura filiformis]|uniref:LOW QUALITY PROTEIN: elongation factor 1-delta-like n=1 Tax=Amphiura filiformis TaxID=82378 RepID=UPI003B227FE0